MSDPDNPSTVEEIIEHVDRTGEPWTLFRNDDPIAVIVSVADYDAMRLAVRALTPSRSVTRRGPLAAVRVSPEGTEPG